MNDILQNQSAQAPLYNQMDQNKSPQMGPQDAQEQQPQAHKYEFTLPDNAPVNEDDLEAFKSLSRELNIAPQQAQSLLDFALKYQTVHVENEAAAAHKRQESLVNTARKDEEFGGMNFEKSIATAQNALHKFASEGFIAMLDETGLGDHPEMMRLFYNLGQHLNEDQFISTNTHSGQTSKSVADILYGAS